MRRKTNNEKLSKKAKYLVNDWENLRETKPSISKSYKSDKSVNNSTNLQESKASSFKSRNFDNNRNFEPKRVKREEYRKRDCKSFDLLFYYNKTYNIYNIYI